MQDLAAKLQEDLQTTTHNYETQLSIMSEHLANMNDKLTVQWDEIDQLKYQMTNKVSILCPSPNKYINKYGFNPAFHYAEVCKWNISGKFKLLAVPLIWKAGGNSVDLIQWKLHLRFLLGASVV